MGSATILDILGSLVIGGLLLLAAMRMDEQATSNTFQAQQNLTVQQNMTSLVQNLEWDFRKIGFSRDWNWNPGCFTYILKGDTQSVWFLAEVDNNPTDTTVDTVAWWIGNSAIPGCPNPRVRLLYRRVGPDPSVGRYRADTLVSNLGVTGFDIRYIDGSLLDTMSTLPGPGAPKLIQIKLRVEAVAQYNGKYNDSTKNFAVWRETRLTSKNLTYR